QLFVEKESLSECDYEAMLSPRAARRRPRRRRLRNRDLPKGGRRPYLEFVSRKERVRIVHRYDERRVFRPAMSMDGKGGFDARAGSSRRSIARLRVFRRLCEFSARVRVSSVIPLGRSRACETFAALFCEGARLRLRSFARARTSKAPSRESAS